MRPTLRALSVHKPLIRFLGKRITSGSPEAPHAHPAAPADYQRVFGSSGDSSSTSPTKSSGKAVFQEYWEAPEKFWRPRVKTLEEDEIEAILSGGASMR